MDKTNGSNKDLSEVLKEWKIGPKLGSVKESQINKAKMAFESVGFLEPEYKSVNIWRSFFCGALTASLIFLVVNFVPGNKFHHAGAGIPRPISSMNIMEALQTIEQNLLVKIESAILDDASGHVRYSISKDNSQASDRKVLKFRRGAQEMQVVVTLDKPIALDFLSDSQNVLVRYNSNGKLILKSSSKEIELSDHPSTFADWEVSEMNLSGRQIGRLLSF